MPSLNELWTQLQKIYKDEMSTVSYNTWIESAHPISFEGNELLIEVPSALHKKYWEDNLAGKIVETGYLLYGSEVIPNFLPADEKRQQKTQEAQQKAEKKEQNKQKTLLNPKYTFDTFVIGKGNQMAHAAALVVAEDPGSIYNPLFFYGGVGLGKTHLMHAIGHQMLLKRPNAKIKYVSSENFTNDFIYSIQKNRMEEFRNEYRTVDLLLVDDIQFLVNKEGTQEEFFNTFEELYRNNKQIVLTSDRLPNEIPTLPERLVSRFAWGLSVDITPPDLETRTAILRTKAEAENLEIPDDTLSYIAGQIDSNIRELEGALTRVADYAKISNQPMTPEVVSEALKDLVTTKQSKRITIHDIQVAVSEYYGIHIDELASKKRTKSIAFPRHVAMYLSRELTDNSLPKIGEVFGGRDHTTVIHAHEKISKLVAEDELFREELKEIESKLN